MNYLRIYDNLILNAKIKNEKIQGYFENHHIIPRCMNGSDEKENLVKLTAREHFIAHILLVKIYPKQFGLIKAVNMMCSESKNHKRNRINNKMYSWLKLLFSKEISHQQTGSNNSQFGKIWIFNHLLKESKIIQKDDFLIFEEQGWLRGRKINFQIESDVKKYCLFCSKEIHSHMTYCSIKCSVQFKKEKNIYINPFKDKKHSSDIVSAMKGHTRNNGSKNPMFGSKYIYNPETLEFKRCKGDELEILIRNGWQFGMKPRI